MFSPKKPTDINDGTAFRIILEGWIDGILYEIELLVQEVEEDFHRMKADFIAIVSYFCENDRQEVQHR